MRVEKVGLERPSLYEALSREGNPEFCTGLKVVHTLAMRLHAAADVERGNPAGGCFEPVQGNCPSPDSEFGIEMTYASDCAGCVGITVTSNLNSAA
jgi:hypothetical protein